ncbi:hypothetical protein T11_3285 [Trichinella zimbabwensis]|uniref:Uncharacterized protein n=1 Tax=Trichinella zimbabwensis TaxID=268475 RepID=A0A0V1GGP4_9BILA|nr:hypothetical protein T11_3285 [Trichinella zimbabwensis]
MASAVESVLAYALAGVSNSGARVRLINVAIAGLGKACKSLCCAMNSKLNFES